MYVTWLTTVIFTLSLSGQLTTGVGGVNFDISPSRCIATTQDSIQIYCVTDVDKDVTFMELVRNDDDSIVFLKDCSNVTFSEGKAGKFQGSGQLDKQKGQGYLNVSLMQPSSEDTGIYTCIMYYIDQKDHMKMEKASDNLVVEKLDVNILESTLNVIKDRIAAMEQENKNTKEKVLNEMKDAIMMLNNKNDELHQEDVKVMNKVEALEMITSNQTFAMNAMSEKEHYAVAFSVTNTNHMTPPTGQVLVLDNVLLQIGSGYDVDEGIFTAPQNGLYVFHLTVADWTTSCSVQTGIFVQDALVARLNAHDKGPGDQGSISSVVSLTAGDKVFTKVESGRCNLLNGFRTSFSGYLIKAI